MHLKGPRPRPIPRSRRHRFPSTTRRRRTPPLHVNPTHLLQRRRQRRHVHIQQIIRLHPLHFLQPRSLLPCLRRLTLQRRHILPVQCRQLHLRHRLLPVILRHLLLRLHLRRRLGGLRLLHPRLHFLRIVHLKNSRVFLPKRHILHRRHLRNPRLHLHLRLDLHLLLTLTSLAGNHRPLPSRLHINHRRWIIHRHRRHRRHRRLRILNSLRPDSRRHNSLPFATTTRPRPHTNPRSHRHHHPSRHPRKRCLRPLLNLPVRRRPHSLRPRKIHTARRQSSRFLRRPTPRIRQLLARTAPFRLVAGIRWLG